MGQEGFLVGRRQTLPGGWISCAWTESRGGNIPDPTWAESRGRGWERAVGQALAWNPPPAENMEHKPGRQGDTRPQIPEHAPCTWCRVLFTTTCRVDCIIVTTLQMWN